MMTSQDLRTKFLKYFESKRHKVLPSASLVPENDSSVLFTTAGMHPLVPYLLGEQHPLGKRLVDIQKCLRTDDIEEVGDAQHLTFFEMLGFWSLGDYFKKESIHYTFNFFTQVLGFNKDDISITVFSGDEDAPFDQESFDIWKNEIGISEKRIYKYLKKENWWGPVGETGPCGPCTEMFIDTGIDKCGKNCGPSCECDKFVEIGNNVFIEYNRIADDKYVKLKQKNVDVGLGLERLAMFCQNKKTIFEIDIFEPIIKKIEELSGRKYQDSPKEFRIITDHIRAAIFAIADGAIPSNKGAGYVARRLIRRAIVQGFRIDINRNYISQMVELVADIYKNTYQIDVDKISKIVDEEEKKFGANLKTAILEIDSYQKHKSTKVSGFELFNLFQTKGLPLEISLEEIKRRNIPLEENYLEDYNQLLKGHKELSRTASAGMFKGGLADSGEETIKLHTAAHLMLAALRQVLGDQVEQKGSNITAEKLRFDFNNPEKLTPEQIKKVEQIVNKNIEADLPVTVEEMTIEEAKNSGATGVFSDRYGQKVKVYTIGHSSPPIDRSSLESTKEYFSREICGGPHVERTGQLGHFKIIKEESSSAGVRRIKAVLD